MSFLVFLFLAVSAQADKWVRVKLWSEDTKVFFVEGSVHRLQGTESALQSAALPQKQKLTIRRDQGHWLIDGFKAQTIVIDTKFLAIEGSALILNHKKIPPKIILSSIEKAGPHSESPSVQVIGVIPLEKYVMGVLAHEMPAQWPLETLKAQAIAARSYTLAVMKERAQKNYHLESTVMDQVYGFLSDDELTSKYDKVIAAVESTRGQFLESEKKTVLKAYYHADCGGETASSNEAWINKEELVSVTDASCPQNPKAHWNLKISEAEMSRRLKKWAPAGAQRIMKLKTVGAPGRLRVAQVEITWDQGTVRSFEAARFREAIGFFDFKSTQFKIRHQGSTENLQWIFEGQGFGHGVGLCQWGSRRWGQDGWEYKKILTHYYPKAQIKILNGTLVSSKDRTQL